MSKKHTIRRKQVSREKDGKLNGQLCLKRELAVTMMSNKLIYQK